MGKKKKKSDETIPLLTVRGLQKFLFGSKSRGGVTILMICGTIVAVSRAAPIAWDWASTGRDLAESGMTINLKAEVGKIKENVKVVTTEVKRIDHDHSTQMDFMKREMLIQREMGMRQWTLMRTMAGLGAPPDPETLVPTMVPTAVVLVERILE